MKYPRYRARLDNKAKKNEFKEKKGKKVMLVSAIFKALMFYFLYRFIKSLLNRYQVDQKSSGQTANSHQSRTKSSTPNSDITDVEYRVIK